MKTPPLVRPVFRWRFLRGWVAATVALVHVAGHLHAGQPSAPLPPLVPGAASPRLPGKFIWADLVTDNVPVAREFYAGLLGWKFQDLGSYTIALNNGEPVAGLFQRPRPSGTSATPRWFGYISVADVQATRAEVVRAGGRVLAEPQSMARRGEQAVFADPEGALFGVLKSSAGDPQDFLAGEGDWIWIQLMSRDASKASTFYQRVAGYDVVANTASNRLSDYVLTSQGFARATVRTLPSTAKQWNPTWLPFVRVKDIQATVQQASTLGGKVTIPPRTDLFSGRLAVLTDPTGAAFGVLQWSQEELGKGDR